MNKTREEIKEIIKELRRRREFKSQKDIAKYLGYHEVSFSRALNADEIPYEFEEHFFAKFPKAKYLPKNSNEVGDDTIIRELAPPYTKPTDLPIPEWKKDIIVSENQIFINEFGIKFIPIPNGKFQMIVPMLTASAQTNFLSNYHDATYISNYPEMESFVVDKPMQGNFVCFKVINDSMISDNPITAILPDDIVLTRELSKNHWNAPLKIKDFPEWIIYTNKSPYPMVKNITRHDVDQRVITCHSYNETIPDFDLSLDEVQALFYIIDLKRKRHNKLNYS